MACLGALYFIWPISCQCTFLSSIGVCVGGACLRLYGGGRRVLKSTKENHKPTLENCCPGAHTGPPSKFLPSAHSCSGAARMTLTFRSCLLLLSPGHKERSLPLALDLGKWAPPTSEEGHLTSLSIKLTAAKPSFAQLTLLQFI